MRAKGMRKKLLFLLRYYATLALLPTPFRLIFMAINNGTGCSLTDYVGATFRSIPQNMAIAGFATAFPLLLTFAEHAIAPPIRKALPAYNIAAALIISFLLVADTMLYTSSGSRLDCTTLIQYFDTPEKIVGDFTIGYLFTRFAMMVATATLFTLMLYKATPKNKEKSKITPQDLEYPTLP